MKSPGMTDFMEVWKAAARHRRVSRELESLLRALYDAMQEDSGTELESRLEQLLLFLASAGGRTDANCTTTFRFVTAMEPAWRHVAPPLRGIFDDMSGTLHETIYAPGIARTFEATPEQLLARVKALRE
jgi:hypothetical protein